MDAFMAEWGLAILISLAILAVEALAEWRDHRDGLYDDEPDDEPDTWPQAQPGVGPYVSAFTGPLEPHD